MTKITCDACGEDVAGKEWCALNPGGLQFCSLTCLEAWLEKKLHGDCKHDMIANDADGPYCERCGKRIRA